MMVVVAVGGFLAGMVGTWLWLQWRARRAWYDFWAWENR